MDLPPPEICQQIIALHNRLGQSNGAECLDTLLKLFDENGLSWSDLPELFAWHGLTSSSQTKKVRRTVCGMHALVGRASTPSQRLNARNQLIKKLAEESLDWDDLPGILGAQWASSSGAISSSPSDPRDDVPHPFNSSEFDPASLVEDIAKMYVTMKPHVSVIYALWVCFTHVYTRFMIAPRVALNSEGPESGKTTMLELARCLVFRPNAEAFATGAAVAEFLDEGPGSVLLDEVDLNDAETRRRLQQIWNLGHLRRAQKALVVKGKRKLVSLHAPMMSAGIGSFLAPSQKSRTFNLEMEPYTEETKPEREWFRPRSDEDVIARKQELDAIYSYLRHWAAEVKLDLAPPMPPEMLRRFGDNVNGLLSVAYSCGPEWGRRAREAMEFLHEKEKAERPEITITRHGLEIFDAFEVDVIGSIRFNKEVKQLDLPDAKWIRYRGPSGMQTAHPLAMHEQSALLKKVGIVSTRVRPPEEKQCRGYKRIQFEEAWRKYWAVAPDEGEPARERLRLIKSD
jgi:hypothetical protein